MKRLYERSYTNNGMKSVKEIKFLYRCELVQWYTSLKGKFTLFKCIYYRAYSMVGIIIHLMCVKSLQLACN